MDFEFSTEYEDFRKELRSFAENDMPEGFDPDEADKVEIQGIRQKIAQKGWLTLPWPEEYGGMGAPHLKQMVFNEERPLKIINAFENQSAAIMKLNRYFVNHQVDPGALLDATMSTSLHPVFTFFKKK